MVVSKTKQNQKHEILKYLDKQTNSLGTPSY